MGALDCPSAVSQIWKRIVALEVGDGAEALVGLFGGYGSTGQRQTSIFHGSMMLGAEKRKHR